MTTQLVRIEFEVFGKVQGVFFRKYTQKKSKELGLRGWCMNTLNETVKGVLEGEPLKIDQMKKWLQEQGSPASKIEKAVFSEQKTISEYSFTNFDIRPTG